jgi:hypothetical protein
MHSRPTVAGTRMLIDEFILSSRSRAELASPSAIGCHDAVARGAGGAAGRMAYRAQARLSLAFNVVVECDAAANRKRHPLAESADVSLLGEHPEACFQGRLGHRSITSTAHGPAAEPVQGLLAGLGAQGWMR